jgi:hypothetical protein
MGAGAVAVAVVVLAAGARFLRGEQPPARHSEAEAEAELLGDLA